MHRASSEYRAEARRATWVKMTRDEKKGGRPRWGTEGRGKS